MQSACASSTYSETRKRGDPWNWGDTGASARALFAVVCVPECQVHYTYACIELGSLSVSSPGPWPSPGPSQLLRDLCFQLAAQPCALKSCPLFHRLSRLLELSLAPRCSYIYIDDSSHRVGKLPSPNVANSVRSSKYQIHQRKSKHR